MRSGYYREEIAIRLAGAALEFLEKHREYGLGGAREDLMSAAKLVQEWIILSPDNNRRDNSPQPDFQLLIAAVEESRSENAQIMLEERCAQLRSEIWHDVLMNILSNHSENFL